MSADYNALLRHFREASLLSSVSSLLGWDESTYMPHRASTLRGEQMALLARLHHERVASPAVGEWLDKLEEETLDDLGRANVREARRAHVRAVRVPARLVEELARAASRAHQAWREARQNSDFKHFQPHLEAILALLREKADALGHQGCRYDPLLDEYEPGASTAEVREVLAALRGELVPLIQQILGSKKSPDRGLLTREYPVDRQKAFAEAAAAALGFDFEAGRLDVSPHPFCCGMGPGDCRITTRYNERSFGEGLFGVLHEAGHALYEQGLPAEMHGMPAGGACSLGIHESQSRLWENQVGRSLPFWEHFFPRLRQAFPHTLAGVKLDSWMLAVNDVRPSFIRVEADEATYNLHIILRFEVEQALLDGSLAVADLPGAWNESFEKMLGLKVPDDARGCLQDIHWSFGGVGYFPTYTLGNLYAAQLMREARAELPGLDDDFRRGEMSRLKGWLNEKIHRQASIWRAGDLCRRITGCELDHQPFIGYLRDKYSPLYGLQ
jgi:carboxypeptidase Taq